MKTKNGVPILESEAEADAFEYSGDMQWLVIVLRTSLRAAWAELDKLRAKQRA